MRRRQFRYWALLGLGLALLLWHTPGQAQAVAELQEKNRQLEAELQRLQAEYAPVLGLTGAAKKEILAMAGVLAAKPSIAIDFSQQSGEMCFTPAPGNMVHYTVDPSKTTEDVIYMFQAQPFIDHGLQVSKLPKMPLENGKMQPLQWYYYDGKTIEPHHGRQLNGPYLIMSVDVK
jgi:hypothetical protein